MFIFPLGKTFFSGENIFVCLLTHVFKIERTHQEIAKFLLSNLELPKWIKKRNFCFSSTKHIFPQMTKKRFIGRPAHKNYIQAPKTSFNILVWKNAID